MRHIGGMCGGVTDMSFPSKERKRDKDSGKRPKSS